MKVSGAGPYIHSAALCESKNVGSGTRIWAFAHIMEGATIGTYCNIGDHTFIESDVTIGNEVTVKNGVSIWNGVTIADRVFVGPNACFTNDLRPRAEIKKSAALLTTTVVEEGATIGANATIVCGIIIRQYAFVAAGAVVTRDVARHALVVGNPARRKGWVCICGLPLDSSLACSCGREFKSSKHNLGLELAT